jgi:branched-chain amino acid transport system ATP-binding protein
MAAWNASAAAAGGAATGLAAEGITSGYGKLAALREVSLTIAPGEFVAIVGPNGAGKTTLISALSGQLPCWQGRLRWQGQDITGHSIARRVQAGISAVPQAAPAFPGMSVAGNIDVARSVANKSDSDQLERVLQLLPELYPKQQSLAGTLSGGQRQMLALARAMSQSPALLMLDEPSFGLAIGVRQRVVDMLRQYRRQTGCSVLMAEQDVGMIKTADRVFFMRSGRIEQVRG